MTSIKNRVANSGNNSEEFDKYKALSLYYDFLNYVEEGEYENFKLARDLLADPLNSQDNRKESNTFTDFLGLNIKKDQSALDQSTLKKRNKRKRDIPYDNLYEEDQKQNFVEKQKAYGKDKIFYIDEELQQNEKKKQEEDQQLLNEMAGVGDHDEGSHSSFQNKGAAGLKIKSPMNDAIKTGEILGKDFLDKSPNYQNLQSTKVLRPFIAQYEPDSDEIRRKTEGDSDFTASFYGPVFGSHVELEDDSEQEGSLHDNSEKGITERSYKSEKISQSAKSSKTSKSGRIEPVNVIYGDDHRYKLVRETHSYTYKEDSLADDYRIFIFTQQDNEKRTVLHTAAKFGDKYFATMILKEAENLGILDQIIDQEDQNGATPLYLLCEQGYRQEKQKVTYIFNRWDVKAKKLIKKRQGVQFEGDKDNYDNQSLKSTLPSIKELEKIMDINYQEKVRIRTLLTHGLVFTVEEPMEDLIDDSEQHQNDNECKVPSRSLLIDLLVENGASTNHQSQVNKMTPIHWLAYQGDYRGMVVILNKNKSHLEIPRCFCQTQEQYYEINGAPEAFLTKDDQTPADIAGTRKNFKTLGCYLTYFLNSRDKIEEAYITDKEKSRFEKGRFTKDRWKTFNFNGYIEPQKVELVFLNSLNFRKKQISYLRMAYWAFFIGNFAQDPKTKEEFQIRMKKIIYFFVIDLGINPFIHSYQGKSLIHACIESQQPEFLEELLSHIYWVQDEKEAELLKESVQVIDKIGNNIYHQIFQLKGNFRNDFLNIVFDHKYYLKINYERKQKSCFSVKTRPSSGIIDCDECIKLSDQNIKCRAHQDNFYDDDIYKDVVLVPIGGFQQANHVGLLPYQLDHDYPPEEMDDIKTDDEIFNKLCHKSDDLTKLYIESFEADYVIETEEIAETDRKANYIWNQLTECNLERDRDYWVYQTKLDPGMCCKKQYNEHYPRRVYFVIKITNQDIDETAEQLKLLCDLDNSLVRLPYNKEMSQAFTQFDDRQRYECVMHILANEIDFKNLVATGIITKHYPLHKLNFYDKLKDSYLKNSVQLSRRLMCGNWKKYLEPIHQMKRYMGERYAFYYFFLMTFNSFMIIPAVLGGILFLYQVSNSMDQPLPERVDTIWNGLFCILMAIWSSFFVEIWKQKESDIITQWNLDDGKDLAQTDERKGKFRSEKTYDHIQNKIVKMPRGDRNIARYKNRIFTFTMIVITVATMVGFEYIIDVRNQTDTKNIDISLNPLDEYLSQAVQNKTKAEEIFAKQLEENIRKNQDNPSLIGKVSVYLSKAALMIDWIGLLYSFVLAFYGTCYEKASKKIVELYNFQFKKDYNDQLARQIFYFSVVNEYLPLGYMAFYKQSFPALWSMLVSRLAISPIKGMILKLINMICDKNRREVKKLQLEYDQFQKDLRKENKIPDRQVHMLLQLDVNLRMKENDLDLNSQFMEIVIQFGKISLFAPCFPLAGLIVLINNYFTILAGIEDIDVYKRTLPEFSQGIGSFIGFIESLSYLSVCTNMAILIWTSNRIPSFFVVEHKVLTIVQFTLMIIGVEHLLFIIKIILDQFFYIDEDILKMQKNKKKAIENQYYDKLKEVLENNQNQKQRRKKVKGKKDLDSSILDDNMTNEIQPENLKLKQNESEIKHEEDKTLDSIKVIEDDVNSKEGEGVEERDMRKKRPKKVRDSPTKKHTGAHMIMKSRKKVDEEKYIEFQLFEDDNRDDAKLKNEVLKKRFEQNINQ